MGCSSSCDGTAPAAKVETSLFATKKPHFLTDEIFRKYDKNDNGELEIKELAALMSDAFPGENFSESDLKAICNNFDLDQNGSIGTNELRAFLRHYDPASQLIKTKTALIIIDVQNDFITGSLANPYNAEEIVPIINDIRDKFDMVVISYDWHPHEHCSFSESISAGNHPIVEEVKQFENFSPVTLKGDSDRPEHTQVLYPRHAVEDTEGAKCHKDLVLKPTDKSIYKGTKPNIDSYSAFFDNIKANDTGLTAMLEQEGITDVYCCGLVTDICVKSTALHAAEGGFKVFVIEDASKPLSQDNVEPTKQVLQEAGVRVLNASEAVAEATSKKDVTIKEFGNQIKKSKSAKSIHVQMEPTLSSHFRAAGKAAAFAATLSKTD
eukprot:gb/GFBE01061624.1/.p1 GENE.gb/GFBE01061624.1/~~gb/GFBE01061624.1/.p1  ORF type:complete len:380 (+),score=97.93 gb/GFBE01061624.1/:1-1140(+)